MVHVFNVPLKVPFVWHVDRLYESPTITASFTFLSGVTL